MLNLCSPLTFFIILVIVWIVMVLFTGGSMRGQVILNTLIWGLLLGVIIYYLCSIGLIGWAWFVVFIPLILMTAIMLMVTLGMGIGLGIEAGRKVPIINNLYEQKSKK
jgi:hypothetical protein